MFVGANYRTCEALAIAICACKSTIKFFKMHPKIQEIHLSDAEKIIAKLNKQGYDVVKMRPR